jgi:hypothetical protein
MAGPRVVCSFSGSGSFILSVQVHIRDCLIGISYNGEVRFQHTLTEHLVRMLAAVTLASCTLESTAGSPPSGVCRQSVLCTVHLGSIKALTLETVLLPKKPCQ